jgi:hypothetical protein
MIRDGWGTLLVRALEYLAAGIDGDDLTEPLHRLRQIAAVAS